MDILKRQKYYKYSGWKLRKVSMVDDFVKSLREKERESVANCYYSFSNKNVLLQGDLINELDIFLESYY